MQPLFKRFAAFLAYGVFLSTISTAPAIGQGFGDFGGDEALFPNLNLDPMAADKTSEPVVWSADYEKVGGGSNGNQAVVRVTAKLGKTWHIYSTTQPSGGPLKTKLTVVGPEGVVSDGAFQPDREPKKSLSSVYKGVTIEEYEGQVTWSVNVALPDGFEAPIEVKVSGLVCDSVDGRCMPTGETLVAMPAGTAAATGGATNAASPAESVVSAEFRDASSVVGWTASLSPSTIPPGGTAVLRLTAIPDPSFHVYAAAVDDSRSSTNFVVTEKSGLKVGAPVTAAKTITQPETKYQPAADYHGGRVTWHLPIEVPDDLAAGLKTIRGKVLYLACTESSCQLPLAFEFVASVSIGNDDASAVSLELSKAKTSSVLDAASELQWVDTDVAAIEPSLTDDNFSSAVESIMPLAGAEGESGGGLSSGGLLGNEFAGGDMQGAAADPTPADLSGSDLGIQTKSSSLSLPWLLMFGFAGGIVLNVMPCVLPVIGLKVMSFISQSGEDRGRMIALNLAYIAGIFVVFFALASLAVLFGLSWGQQFQNFSFRLTITIAVFAFALSYLGFWEIPTPTVISKAASKDAGREGLGGAFSKGAFATILATPCSAPLLGSVFGQLVKEPPVVTFSVFMAIAAGMALPFAIIGFVPSAAKFMPKPGAWMEKVKELMAFALLGAVAFFFYQFSDANKLPLFITLIGVWLGCWIIGQVPAWETGIKRLTAFVGGIAVATAVGLFGFLYVGAPSEVNWKSYDRQLLADYRAQGKTVMLDFGATWCLNCIVNSNVAIDTSKTARKLDQLDAVGMYADLSDSESEQTQKLWNLVRQFDSNSIPLLVIFPGSRPDEPIILRDIVTQSTVLEQLEQAGPSVDFRQAGLPQSSGR